VAADDSDGDPEPSPPPHGPPPADDTNGPTDDFERELELKPDDPGWDGQCTSSDTPTPVEQPAASTEPETAEARSLEEADMPEPRTPEAEATREASETNETAVEIRTGLDQEPSAREGNDPDSDPRNYEAVRNGETGDLQLRPKFDNPGPATPREHMAGDTTGGAWERPFSPEGDSGDRAATYQEGQGWTTPERPDDPDTAGPDDRPREDVGQGRKSEAADNYAPEETTAKKLAEDGEDAAKLGVKLYDAAEATTAKPEQPHTVTGHEQPRLDPVAPEAPGPSADPIGSLAKQRFAGRRSDSTPPDTQDDDQEEK
jgi:hypothetical protein